MAHKLLLADDSVTIQRVIELTFADEDVQVTTVGDGQLAIDRLDSDPPDIVLADVDMPKRDGYEVAAYVKSRPALAHIPVVLLTGAFEPIDQARAAAAGSSDVLAKPFEPQMVINRVKELLGKKRPDDAGTYSASAFGASDSMEPTMGDPLSPERPPANDAQPVSLDDYFDQLDAAFSNLQPGAPPAEAADEMHWAPAHQTGASGVGSDPGPSTSAPASPAAFTFAQTAPVEESDEKPAASVAPVEPIAPPVPVAPVAPIASVAPVAPVAPIAPIAPVAPVASAGPVAVSPVPPVTTAARPQVNPFAHLSAAKAEAAARPAAPVITDEVIEEIVSRVLQRMTDRIVRETVTDIVSQTAERLVQEEIEKMKGA